MCFGESGVCGWYVDMYVCILYTLYNSCILTAFWYHSFSAAVSVEWVSEWVSDNSTTKYIIWSIALEYDVHINQSLGADRKVHRR